MSQEDKIKAAYAAAVQRDIYVTNYLSFKTGYLAAIEDIKARGRLSANGSCAAMDLLSMFHLTNNPLEFPEWDVTQLYRLED